MKNTFFKAILTGAFMSFGSAGSLTAAECIAPANPGGGWDFTCRTITKIMYDIGAVDSPIQVTNMAGGGGGLAYAHVVNERNNDDSLIVAASSATATRLAQNAYSGMTYDQVRFLGAIGADPGVIVVAMDSPHKTLNDLLKALASSGGMLGLSLYPHHLKDGSNCTLENFCEMIARTAEIMETKNIGIGSDLCINHPDNVVEWMRNGTWAKNKNYGEGSKNKPGFPKQPDWFLDARGFNNIEMGLKKVGFNEDERNGILGNNWYNFYKGIN